MIVSNLSRRKQHFLFLT